MLVSWFELDDWSKEGESGPPPPLWAVDAPNPTAPAVW